MKIYLDLILIVNFFIDFLILLSVSIVLKRKTKLIRILTSSLIGSLTILILFIPMNNIELFLFKLLTSIILILISFGYIDIKHFLNNLLYFYTISITLGGILYFLKLELSLENKGLIFHNTGLEINIIFIVIFSPIILYIYIRQLKKLKITNTYKRKVNVYINNQIIELSGYIDSGNTLTDPYNNKYVIIAKNKKLEEISKTSKTIYVPFKTVNHEGIIKCIIPQSVYIENLGMKTNVIIGLSKEKIKLDGINCLLNILLMEEK